MEVRKLQFWLFFCETAVSRKWKNSSLVPRTVCVCTAHQNAEVMLKGFGPAQKWHTRILSSLCNPPQDRCFLNAGSGRLQNLLEYLLENWRNLEENDNWMCYKHWISTDGSALEAVVITNLLIACHTVSLLFSERCVWWNKSDLEVSAASLLCDR